MKKLLLILNGAVLLLGGCSKDDGYRSIEGIAWNTFYHITYSPAKELTDSITQIFDEIDRSLSPFNENSTVSKINVNKDGHTDLHFVTVYDESKKINRESGGAFDPTLAPLIRAWGFGQGHKVSADTLRLDSLLAITGIDKTEIEGTTLYKADPRIEFNFSALAKGYGVDCIAAMLERNGVFNYLVEVGGEIRASGHNPQGQPWTIGIDRPEEGAQPGDYVTALALGSGAVATSGNYRNYQDTKEGRVGHTISSKSGRPVATDVISATVVAPSCMEADALATCCMALGSEAALELCNRMRVGVLLILDDMTTVSNPVFRAFGDFEKNN